MRRPRREHRQMRRSGMLLTREMLLKPAGSSGMIAEGAPGLRLLTEAERAASLAEAAGEAAGPRQWGLGVRLWLADLEPGDHFAERRFARVHGWHRSFCLSTAAGRGTPEAPGLVLGLDRGGACAGAAFRIAEEHARGGADAPVAARDGLRRLSAALGCGPRRGGACRSARRSPSPSGATARSTPAGCRRKRSSGGWRRRRRAGELGGVSVPDQGRAAVPGDQGPIGSSGWRGKSRRS